MWMFHRLEFIIELWKSYVIVFFVFFFKFWSTNNSAKKIKSDDGLSMDCHLQGKWIIIKIWMTDYVITGNGGTVFST